MKKIESCRICGNRHLVEVLDLGAQALTGVFPKTRTQAVTEGPLRLVKCMGDDTVCGLLQLQHTYDSNEMYGDNYGYRSGLNPSMVEHLRAKVKDILSRVQLSADALVVDIGSNDGTTLSAYPSTGCTLVGIDPTGSKFKSFYPPHVRLIPDFFSGAMLSKHFPGRRARVITSFSMFYDLEAPMQFMQEVAAALEDDGVWVFEQSYMPTMLAKNSYDTVCHEHLEYYALRQIKFMADRTGLKILDVEFNDVNGGSFSVVATKADSAYQTSERVAAILAEEERLGLNTLLPYQEFAKRVADSRVRLRAFFDEARKSGRKVCALGASTKGNVVLQYCNVTADDVALVGEVNGDKYGSFTPGTLLLIVSEEQVLGMNPDYLLVLPWHFKRFFDDNPKFAGRTLVYPLPTLDVVTR